MNGHEQDVKFCKFLPRCPGRVITGSKDKTIRVWNIRDSTNKASRIVENYKMYGDGAFSAMCVMDSEKTAKVVYTGAGLDGTPEMFSTVLPLVIDS